MLPARCALYLELVMNKRQKLSILIYMLLCMLRIMTATTGNRHEV